MKILLIDDEKNFSEQAKMFLEKINDQFRVTTIDNPEKAVNILDEHDFDAIVSDYQMPEMNGLELLKNVRDKGKDDPFIIFTGHGREEVAMDALNLGADRYLRKGGHPKSQFEILASAIEQEFERKKMKRQRNIQRTYFQQLFENSPEAIVLLDNEDRIMKANESFEELFLYDRDKIKGKKIHDLIIPQRKHEEAISLTQEAQKRNVIEELTVRKRKDGEVVDVSVLGYPIELNGETIGVYGVYRKISEEEKKSILKTEETYKSIYDTTLAIAEESDLDPTIEVIADEAKELLETDDCTVYLMDHERNVLEPIYTNDPEYYEEIMNYKLDLGEGLSGKVAETGEGDYINFIETEGTHIPGTEETADQESVLTVPMFDNERILGVISVGKLNEGFDDKEMEKLSLFARQAEIAIKRARDLEELKKSREDLNKSKNKIEELHRVSRNLESHHDPQKVYELALEASEGILDFDMCTIDIVENDQMVVKATSSDLPQDGSRSTPTDEGIAGKTYKNQESYLLNDITSEKEAEPVKKEYKSAISVPIGEIGVFQAVSTEKRDFDQEDVRLAELLMSHVDGALERIRAEKEIKKSEKKFRKFFNNLGNAIIITKIDKENNGEIIEANEEAVKQTGYSRDELLEMNIIDDLALESPIDKSFEGIRKKLQEGLSLDFTQKKEKKDGTEYWTDVVATPIEYKGEKVCLSVIRDITEKKKTEKKEEFLHSLLRHNLRNKIQIAQGYQELLEDTKLSENQNVKLEKSKNSIKESLELIEKVRELREIEKAEKEIKGIDLTKILKEVIEEKRKIGLEEGIEINYELNDEKIEVLGGSLLKELFSNIIGNCIQHSNGSKIFISLKKEDKHIKTIIKDNGEGLSKRIKDKIFERGFRTEESPGSGLGMHLVKRITELYDGEIKIKDSEIGGARFDIHLKKP